MRKYGMKILQSLKCSILVIILNMCNKIIDSPTKFNYENLLCSLAVKNLLAIQETQVRFLGWEDPLEERMKIHSSILAWRILWTRGAWWATVHGVAQSWI